MPDVLVGVLLLRDLWIEEDKWRPRRWPFMARRHDGGALPGNVDELVEQLERERRDDNREGAWRTLHSLTGMARNFGATRLGVAAAELQRGLYSRDASAEGVGRLSALVAETWAALERRFLSGAR